jgi:hypothetical protein
LIVQVFGLEPKVRGLDVTDEELEISVKEELSAQQKANKMKELTSLYGTKKLIKEVSLAPGPPYLSIIITGSFYCLSGLYLLALRECY